MWSVDRLARVRSVDGLPATARPDVSEITAALICMHVKRGHELRARAIDGMLRRFGSWLVAAVRHSKRLQSAHSPSEQEPYALIEHELKAPLASIRSAAEILRHNQDLPIDERNEFLDVVIQDNGRLERVVDGLLHALDPDVVPGRCANSNQRPPKETVASVA